MPTSKNKISKRKSFFILSVFSISMLGVFFLILWGSRAGEHKVEPTHAELEFVTVENPDSLKYLTVINPKRAVDILVVSKYFYQHEEYWSYICRDNSLDNLLNIPAGTVVRIPRIDSIGQKNSLAKAKLLGDQLLKKQFTTKDD